LLLADVVVAAFIVLLDFGDCRDVVGLAS